jgi:putative membrane protein
MDPVSIMLCLAFALIGVSIAALASLVPGLHIYNVIAITMVIFLGATAVLPDVDPMVLTSFLVGLVVGFTMLFTVSSQFFQPCDDDYRFMMMPHEKFLFEGKAHEAVVITGIGSFAGIVAIAVLFPLLGAHIAIFRDLFQDHLYWVVGAVIVFILMTEWPKDVGAGNTLARRLMDGWTPLLMGYVTFVLSGIFGMFIFHKTIIPVGSAFQSLMPVFVGLFAIPAQILTLVSTVKVPRQHVARSVEITGEDVFRGAGSGLLAGAFGAFTPGVTPGPALLMAGHMTVTGGDRQFMLAGGAGRIMYYIGALLLFFLPGIFLRRGGASINISLFFVPETEQEFLVIAGVIAIAGAVSFVLLFGFSRLCAFLVSRINYKVFSMAGIILLSTLVLSVTGWTGLLIMLVGTMIGLIPNLWHTRRINLLAVLLVPMFLNMAGVGSAVAEWFGFVSY